MTQHLPLNFMKDLSRLHLQPLSFRKLQDITYQQEITGIFNFIFFLKIPDILISGQICDRISNLMSGRIPKRPDIRVIPTSIITYNYL